MNNFWMTDRGHRVLRFPATQATSISTVVTGHHITPLVFSRRISWARMSALHLVMFSPVSLFDSVHFIFLHLLSWIPLEE